MRKPESGRKPAVTEATSLGRIEQFDSFRRILQKIIMVSEGQAGQDTQKPSD